MEKYYRIGSDGTYSIHFPNNKGLSIEEIREIFSSYGQVLSINISGDLNGLRYIRYKTLEETLRCLENLQNNSDIRILPQKIKKTDQKYSNQRQAARVDNSFQKASNTNRQFNSNLNGKFSTAAETSSHNRNGSDLDSRSDNSDNFTNTYSPSSRQNTNFNRNVNKYKKPVDSLISDRKHLLSSQQQNLVDNGASNYEVAKQQESGFCPLTKSDANSYLNKDKFVKNKIPALISESEGKEKFVKNKIPALISESEGKEKFVRNKIPALISESEGKENDFGTMSDHSLPVGIKNVSPKIIVIPMQEVIVANIHSDYGVHYILHLFEKHNPISATCVKTISETGIRYCHIYFKTVQEALTIEEQFDNFALSGKNLIVLRKSRLINTAMCK